MTRTRPPSRQTVAVLEALAADPARWRYGYDLCAELGIQAGSMYPILIRLADRKLLETAWEPGPVTGRPARHLYRLTGAGRSLAASLGTEAQRPSAAARAARRTGPRLEGA